MRINLDELGFPPKCPHCSGNRFTVSGARKLFFRATYKVTDEGVKLEDDINEDIDWEVAYSVKCADCGVDLSKDLKV